MRAHSYAVVYRTSVYVKRMHNIIRICKKHVRQHTDDNVEHRTRENTISLNNGIYIRVSK